MRTAKVVVLPYDEGWKQAFADIKAELCQISICFCTC